MAPKASRSPSPSPHPVDLAIRQVLAALPRGRVAPYSRVALLAGIPGGARRVSRALKALEGVPWWRVVRADLTLAKEVAVAQRRRLLQEGVAVVDRKVPHSAEVSAAELLERLTSRRR